MRRGEFPNITGQKFGKIFVLDGKVPVGKALIKCECGAEKVVSRYDIFKGKVVSCGSKGCMDKGNDLSGRKFSCLTVLREALDLKEISGRCLQWECQCDCGTVLTVPSNQLTSGRTKSCGCKKSIWLSEKNSLPIEIVAQNQLFVSYKRNAKSRNLDWQLSKEEFVSFLKQNCFYCGVEPLGTITKNKVTGVENYTFNGIDRQNSCQGYSVDNCVPCCKLCNHAKNDLTRDKFFALFLKLFKFNFGGKNMSDEIFYFDIVSADRKDKKFLFGQKISQSEDELTINGIEIDTSKVLRSQIDAVSMFENWKNNKRTLVINIKDCFLGEVSLYESLQAGLKH